MIFVQGDRVRARVDIGRKGKNLVPAGTKGAATRVENDIVHVIFDGGDAWQFEGDSAYDSLEHSPA